MTISLAVLLAFTVSSRGLVALLRSNHVNGPYFWSLLWNLKESIVLLILEKMDAEIKNHMWDPCFKHPYLQGLPHFQAAASSTSLLQKFCFYLQPSLSNHKHKSWSNIPSKIELLELPIELLKQVMEKIVRDTVILKVDANVLKPLNLRLVCSNSYPGITSPSDKFRALRWIDDKHTSGPPASNNSSLRAFLSPWTTTFLREVFEEQIWSWWAARNVLECPDPEVNRYVALGAILSR